MVVSEQVAHLDDAIVEARSAGIRVVMITGDAREVAEAVAADLGVDEVKAEVLPRIAPEASYSFGSSNSLSNVMWS